VLVLYHRHHNITSPRSLIGIGKTRVAAFLIATALELDESYPPPSSSSSSSNNNNTTIDIVVPPNKNRILAVTHSNGAADVLLSALLSLSIPAIRLGRPASVSPDVRHRTVTAIVESIPEVRRLRREVEGGAGNTSNKYDLRRCIEEWENIIVESAPVVVSSCIGVARQLKFSSSSSPTPTNGNDQNTQPRRTTKNMNFPLVISDEAAQTTEPALLTALVTAGAEQLVLLGDTKQLPPTVTCTDGWVRESLGRSPMERLEKEGVAGGYGGRGVNGDAGSLTVQYRMPKDLVLFPSRYFYGGRLKSADDFMTRSEAGIGEKDGSVLPPKGFAWPKSSRPLAFVDVGGGKEGNSTSATIGVGGYEVAHAYGGGKSNPTEVDIVVDIVEDLLAAGEVDAKDISVISPYSRQVQLIRTELTGNDRNGRIRRSQRRMRRRGKYNDFSSSLPHSTINTDDVRVGTVDSFQGQETEVVIFSAVRSNSEGHLGFLRDPRRLCVAITRARRGLILVGDVRTLRSNRHWTALIDSCEERDCLVDICNLKMWGENEDGVDDEEEGRGNVRSSGSDAKNDSDTDVSLGNSTLDDLLSEFDQFLFEQS